MTNSTAVQMELSPKGLGGHPRERARNRSRGTGKIVVGSVVLGLMLLASLVAPLPHSPTTPDGSAISLPPGNGHWFGTDSTGFDVFSRTVAAARVDLPIALAGAAIAMIVGSAIGILAATRSRSSDAVMRVVDIFQSFPLIIVILAILSVTGGGDVVLALTISLVNIPAFIRLVRAEAMIVLRSRFVEYAQLIGSPRRKILLRHVLPNTSGVILAQLSLAAATAVSVLAAISFLGQGVPPPTASWGSMIQDGSHQIGVGQWWPVVFPATALAASIFSLNLLADGVDARMTKGIDRD